MSPAEAIVRLGPVYQAALALGGAVAIGMAVAFALAGWVSLPARVEAQGDAIVEQGADIAVLKGRIGRIDCVVTAMATKVDPIKRCGL